MPSIKTSEELGDLQIFKFLGLALLQAIEEVKEEIRVLKEGGQGSLTDEQYEQKQQLLLMKWFRVTGPAKVEAGVKHVEGLLDQGKPLGCLLRSLCTSAVSRWNTRLGDWAHDHAILPNTAAGLALRNIPTLAMTSS